jgi:integrase
MARTLKDTSLDTRTARKKLKARGKPHYRTIEEGLHLGYRKLRGRKGKPEVSGRWVWRRYVEDQKSKTGKKQPYIVDTIGIADDITDADGVAVLNFAQAQNKLRDLFKQNAHAEAGVGPYTVAAAIRDYLQKLDHGGKDTTDAEYRSNANIIPQLGSIECSKLTADKIRGWLSALASAPARLRNKKDGKQKYREFNKDDPEQVRKRRASANRMLAILRAALNFAFEEKKVANASEWQRVKPFEQVNIARARFLTVAEAQRLIRRCDPEFRSMVEAALASACRYGELCALDVQDYDPDTETLSIRRSKGGKTRKVYLTPEGVKLFNRLAAGRLGNEPLIRNSDGERFGRSHQARPMRAACLDAKINPPVSFHQLRHTFASLLVKSGTPMSYVAEALGHSSTQMTERFYSHLAPSHVAETIRKNAPTFGLGKSNVVGLR